MKTTNRKTVLVADKEWRKHLRNWGKRQFWKKHRKVEKNISKSESNNL